MSDVILTEDEFAAIKEAIDEAKALRDRCGWLSTTARRITRDDIAIPRLRMALARVEAIDLENPRHYSHTADTTGAPAKVIDKATKANDDANGSRTRPTPKRHR